VAVSGTAFEGAKRVFGQGSAASHHVFASGQHARPMPIDHVLVFPALDLAPLAPRP
jgi:hypothetical protein